jgi:hypothetical protein
MEKPAMDEQKTKKRPDAATPKEFTGRIEGITANSQFRFDLAGKKSGRTTFSIPSGDTAMAGLVTACYLAGKKISVTGLANGGAIFVASEVRLGAKPKAKKAKAYPKKLKASPDASAPTVTPQA